MRRASDRAVLSRAKPAAIWRLARWLKIHRKRCDCPMCLAAIVERCVREMTKEVPCSDG